MRKLKLQELQVDSFIVNGPADDVRGTVKANSTYYPPSWDTFCPTGDECTSPPPLSKTGSCQPSCVNYTCEGITCGTLIC